MKFLVVEDHPLVREGLVSALRRLDGGVVAECAKDPDEAFAAMSKTPYDLVLLDLHYAGATSGMAALPVMIRRYAGTRVLVISTDDDAKTIAEAIDAGAQGFVSKLASLDMLLEAVRNVLVGGQWIPPEKRAQLDRVRAARGRSGESLAARYGLTEAQTRVAVQLADGASNQQIADRLGIAMGTVKIHVAEVKRALGCPTRAAVAVFLKENG